MFTPSTVLQSAFARVVARTGAAPGAPVGFSAMAREWSGLGMSMDDLRDAIRELIENRYARACATVDGLAIEPTAEGLRRLAASVAH